MMFLLYFQHIHILFSTPHLYSFCLVKCSTTQRTNGVAGTYIHAINETTVTKQCREIAYEVTDANI